MDRNTAIKNNMPHFYCVEDTPNHKSVLGAIINRISADINDTDKRIGRIDAMLGISTTYGEDLDCRWGNLLDMKRRPSEEDEMYRNRLRLAFMNNADTGGTKQAITNAVAVVLGIAGDAEAIKQQIKIDDAWEYDGPHTVIKEYGYIVCTVLYNSTLHKNYNDIKHAIMEAIINTKSAGIIAQLIFGNASPKTYRKLGDDRYSELEQDQYMAIGGVSVEVITHDGVII